VSASSGDLHDGGGSHGIPSLLAGILPNSTEGIGSIEFKSNKSSAIYGTRYDSTGFRMIRIFSRQVSVT
jgi:hypothetical protein